MSAGVAFPPGKHGVFFAVKEVFFDVCFCQKDGIRRFVSCAGALFALLTGQIPEIGSMLSPMHLPALLCGFVCGWPWGLAVGFVAPLFRTLCFGMPPFATALAMAFELAAYGAFSGLLYRLLPKKVGYLYVSLIGAMIGGRLVWGAVQAVITGVAGTAFGLQAFWMGAVANAIPGIICQIVLVPLLVLALGKAGLLPDAPVRSRAASPDTAQGRA